VYNISIDIQSVHVQLFSILIHNIASLRWTRARRRIRRGRKNRQRKPPPHYSTSPRRVFRETTDNDRNEVRGGRRRAQTSGGGLGGVRTVMSRPAADASPEHRIFGVSFYSFLYRRIMAVRVPTTYLHTITAVLLVYGNSIMIFVMRVQYTHIVII